MASFIFELVAPDRQMFKGPAEAVAQRWFDDIGTIPQLLLTDKLTVF